MIQSRWTIVHRCQAVTGEQINQPMIQHRRSVTATAEVTDEQSTAASLKQAVNGVRQISEERGDGGVGWAVDIGQDEPIIADRKTNNLYFTCRCSRWWWHWNDM